jgi:transmembrane sensor
MNPSSLEELFKRYYDKSATAEEKAKLFQLIEESSDQQLMELIYDNGMQLDHSAIASNGNGQAMLNNILQKSGMPSPVRRIKWMWAAAAVFVVSISLGYFFLSGSEKEKNTKANNTSPEKYIKPGGNKAILTLADGKQIILDNAANGDLTSEANVKVIKLSDGQISYQTTGNTNEITYNTIVTPNGGQYQLILSDGSKVWLNAASSLRFPASFAGTQRSVELSGEGYFEIAPDRKKPFQVLVNGNKVEVLGTHFNINAYNDEPSMTTTLLEGKIKLNSQGSISIMKPGEQAKIELHGKIQLIENADVEEAIAWKNGKFIFNSNNIQSIMRQLSRWYDIEVEYSNNLPNEEYKGALPRSENISKVLHFLRKTQTIDFKISGKRITVIPYKN